MVDTGILCTSDDVIRRAGVNANATIASFAYTNDYIKTAEGKICLDTRYNWTASYAIISTIGKEILREATASKAAIDVINDDMSGYTSRQEALIMINVLWAKYSDVVSKIIKDNKYKDFILNGTGDIN
jgi:hypothetical protein